MLKKPKLNLSALLLASLFAATWVSANQDAAGSFDIPGLGRFPGSYIDEQVALDYSSVRVPMGVNSISADQEFPQQVVEGERVVRTYSVPEAVTNSPLKVVRSLQAGLKKAGFEERWSCEEDGCGWFMPRAIYGEETRTVFGDHVEFNNLMSNAHIISAVKESATGNEYLVIILGKSKYHSHIQYSIDWIREAPLEVANLVLTEDKLIAGLAEKGTVTLGGLQFAYDSIEMVGDSDKVLALLANYLKDVNSTSSVSYLVVGHTDSKGSHDYNLSLSQRRAHAVVEALYQHGVKRALLQAVGVGNAAPVATNRDENGRSQNRRVELVEVIQ